MENNNIRKKQATQLRQWAKDWNRRLLAEGLQEIQKHKTSHLTQLATSERKLKPW